MSQTQTIAQLSQTRAPDPLYRKLQRVFLAFSVLVAPLVMAGWFTLCPQYGDPTCPSNPRPDAVFAAFRAASPGFMQVFYFLTLLAPYLYPLGYIGLGLLAMKRSPWLAMLGMVLGWVGSIAWGFISDGIFTLSTAIQLGQDTSFALFEKSYFMNPLIVIVAIGWVLGHWGGYVVLGIALWRSRTIPRWAAILIIISGPLMGPIAYGVNIGFLQILGFILVFVGSIPAAIALSKERNEALLSNKSGQVNYHG